MRMTSKTSILTILSMALSPLFLNGQASLQFEVVSIRPAPATARLFPRLQNDGSQMLARAASLRFLITQAYDLENYQLINNVKWIDNDLFTVTAKLPPASGGARIPEMLRNFLEDKFRLKAHYEKRSTKVYELVVAKSGPKLTTLRDGESPAAPLNPDPEQGVTLSAGETMSDLVKFLNARSGSAALGWPVVDHTGLNGRYKIWLTYSNHMDPDGRSGTLTIDYISELPRQLGLALRPTQSECTFFVIDHAVLPADQ